MRLPISVVLKQRRLQAQGISNLNYLDATQFCSIAATKLRFIVNHAFGAIAS